MGRNMKIRTSNSVRFDSDNKWSLFFYDEDDTLITMSAIPPTNGNRIDIITEDRSGFCDNIIEHAYLYNFKGNHKKLRKEKILIIIENGTPRLEYWKNSKRIK